MTTWTMEAREPRHNNTKRHFENNLVPLLNRIKGRRVVKISEVGISEIITWSTIFSHRENTQMTPAVAFVAKKQKK